MTAQSDVLVVGGGILGLATAHCLLAQRPGTSVVVLEKETAIALHQTGRNSGVLHSGMYYKPGSLKAANCRAGKQAMEEFCRREGIACEICGKVIVAVGACNSNRTPRESARSTCRSRVSSTTGGCRSGSEPSFASVAARFAPVPP